MAWVRNLLKVLFVSFQEEKGGGKTTLVSHLIPAERRNRILNLLQKEGSVQVAALSDLLGVSEVTIRRDLDLLDQKGLLERTHGGAVLSRRMRVEPSYTAKYQSYLEEKRKIGIAAAALVDPGETIFIHSGSTTLQIFRHLAGKKVRVITSNAGAIAECQGLDIELFLIGGYYREQSHSLIGPLSILSLQRVYASKGFIGVDGISIKYGLTTPNLEEAEVARTMIERTRGQVIVVADHSKLGVVADCATAPIEKVDVLVIDADLDEGYRHDLENLGIKVVIAR